MAAQAMRVWTELGMINIPNLSPLGFTFGGAGFPNASIMGEEGNIYRETVVSRNPGAINQDNVLAAFTIPAGSFDIAGRGVNLLSQGSVAATVNSKRLKIYWGCTAAVVGSAVSGGTVIADTGAYTTNNAVGWSLEANVFKYGAAGSNTQLALHMSAQIGLTVGTLLVPSALTSTESGPIIVAITGNAVTVVTDIIYNFFEVNAMN